MSRDQSSSLAQFGSIIVPLLKSPGEVPVAPAALMVSWAGLTTFASGLYHAMSRVGEGRGGKRKEKECFSQRAKTKAKLQMREK